MTWGTIPRGRGRCQCGRKNAASIASTATVRFLLMASRTTLQACSAGCASNTVKDQRDAELSAPALRGFDHESTQHGHSQGYPRVSQITRAFTPRKSEVCC